jgi:hypothetical protein
MHHHARQVHAAHERAAAAVRARAGGRAARRPARSTNGPEEGRA